MPAKTFHFEFVQVLDIIDGDTLRVNIDLGFHCAVTTCIRLDGINCPEVRGDEREAGLAAKAFVADVMGQANKVTLTVLRPDKYGNRWVGIFYLDGANLADMLTEAGHAKPYLADGVTSIK